MISFKALHDLPLGRKLTLAILGTSALSVLAVSIFVLIYSIINERMEMHDELESIAHMVGDNSSAALAFGDDFAAKETLESLKNQPSIEVACLYTTVDDVNKLFAEYHSASKTCPATLDIKNPNISATGLTVSAPISLRGSKLGVITIHQNFTNLWAVVRLYGVAIIFSMLVSLLVAGLLTMNLKAWLSAPILELTDTANKISESGDYTLRVSNYGEDEVGQLIQRFNGMLSQIEQQNLDLLESRETMEQRVIERTAEIEQAMGHLKDAQNQLIQTEKLAALGGLVAGVAHEINTPVGVGMTASSSLHDYSQDIMQELENNSLTKATLTDYVENAVEATDIIQKNLGRAADLVRSFKQVAIDQSGLERRNINVEEYLHSILTSLHPVLKKTGLSVEVICPNDLKMETYPGAISQTLTNLIMNSITHGYDGEKNGHISIEVERKGDIITLIYADNGKGIAPEYLPHVFEPFFTTKRDEGGSGLGMHILHNIVTQTLQGAVRLDSELGKGVQFTLELPMNLPAIKNDAYAQGASSTG